MTSVSGSSGSSGAGRSGGSSRGADRSSNDRDSGRSSGSDNGVRSSDSARDAARANDVGQTDGVRDATGTTAAEAEREADVAREAVEARTVDPRDRARASASLGGVDRAALDAQLEANNPMSVNRQAVDATQGTAVSVPTVPGRGDNVMKNTDALESSVTDNGDGTSTLSATRERSGKIGGGVDVGPVGVGVESQGTTQQSYEFSGPTEAVEAVANGTAPRPEAWDPESIPVGGKVTVGDADSQSTEVGADLGYATAEVERQRTEGVSYSVERMTEDTVRVSATNQNAIEDSTMVGAAVGSIEAGVSGGRNFDVADTRTADIDLSTEAGRAAYNDFLDTGRVPATAADGVTPVDTRTTVDLSTNASLKVNSFGHEFSRNGLEVEGVVRPDGSTERAVNADFGQLGVQARVTAAPGQEAALDATVALNEVDLNAARMLRTASGLDPRRDPNGERVMLGDANTASLSLDEAQMMDLRDAARERMPDWESMSLTDTNHPMSLRLAQADSPTAVQGALATGMSMPGVRGESYGLARELSWLSGHGERPLDLGLSITPG